ncbi:MAG: hypothetical protein WC389_08610 [Lutibacter sp.]|jgi:hypothetical protein
MKKNIAIALLCLFTTISYGQTKEETISWLDQKLKTYLYMHWFDAYAEDVTININECFITIRYSNCYDEKNGTKNKTAGQYYQIPTDGVEIGSGNIEMKNGIESIRCESGLIYYTSFAIKQGEENLQERINKAVAHLATFCPKKKETF